MSPSKWKNLAIASLFACAVSSAQSEADPPARVARVSSISGSASVLSQATGPDWTPAQVNFPVTNGDQVWTDAGARAELQLGTAAIRFRGETNASFTSFDDLFVQIRLNSGGLNIHVRDMIEKEVYEIDTPNVAFAIFKPGDYRIQLTPQGTRIIVRSGVAEVSGSDRSVPLRSGDMVEITGLDRLSYSLTSAPPLDDFDKWSADRDRKQDHFPSDRYTSPDMIGASDLDLYGTWSEVPDFGPVWTPTSVDPGWAPYTCGRWVWVSPYGWVWVDEEPWGFSVSHYGRWVVVSGTWVWVPGPPVMRPVWSPALVAWVSGGGIIGVGWFPLGPREPYNPGYRASPAYVSRINRPYFNRGNSPYANRNAAVSVPQADMAAGRPVRGVMTRVNPSVLTQVQPTSVPPAMSRGVIKNPVTRVVARPPADVAARPVIVRNPIGSAAPATATTPAPRASRVERPVEVSSPGPPTVGERADGPVRVRRPAINADESPQSPQSQPQPGVVRHTLSQPAITSDVPTDRMERVNTPERRRAVEVQAPQPVRIQEQPRMPIPTAQQPPPIDRAEPRRAVEPPQPHAPTPAPRIETPRVEIPKVEAPKAAAADKSTDDKKKQ